MAGALMLSVSGCRGIVGDTLTPEVIVRFAGAYGSFLRERAGGRVLVVVGRDGRAGSEMVKASAIAGLTASGCGVIDLDVAMTPSVAVMTDWFVGNSTGEHPATQYFWRGDAGLPAGRRPRVYAAGLVLTASHNPQQWNGLKCLLAEGGESGSAACAPPSALASKIIEGFRSGRVVTTPWHEVGSVFDGQTPDEPHIDRVLDAVRESGLTSEPESIGGGLRAAVDSVNASGRRAASLFLESLGCDEVLALHKDESGLFPHPPEPTRDNLTLPGGLCEAVVKAGMDIGFAQDPDADRLALIDEHGRYIGEEYTLALGAMALLEAAKQPDQVLVTNLSTSRMIDDVAARYGARVIRTAVGEANVVEVMKREKALAGGEGNGGVIWPRVTYVRDSLSAMALTLWLMSPSGGGKGRKRPLSELVASMPSYAIEKRKVDLARRDDSEPAIEKISGAYKDQHVDHQDGAWVDFQKG